MRILYAFFIMMGGLFLSAQKEAVLVFGAYGAGKTVFVQSLIDEKKVKRTPMRRIGKEDPFDYEVKKRDGHTMALIDSSGFYRAPKDNPKKEKYNQEHLKGLTRIFNQFNIRGIIVCLDAIDFDRGDDFFLTMRHLVKIFRNSAIDEICPYIKLGISEKRSRKGLALHNFSSRIKAFFESEEEMDSLDGASQEKIITLLRHLSKKIEESDNQISSGGDESSDSSEESFPRYIPHPKNVWTGDIFTWDRAKRKFNKEKQEAVWKMIESFPKKPLNRKCLNLVPIPFSEQVAWYWKKHPRFQVFLFFSFGVLVFFLKNRMITKVKVKE